MILIDPKRKILFVLLILLFVQCANSDSNTITGNVATSSSKIISNIGQINHDSLLFSKINEKHYDNIMVLAEDTLLRIIYNQPFKEVLVVLIEKNDSLILSSIKKVPQKYYNPLIEYSKTIVEYTFLKNKVSSMQWDNLGKIGLNNILNKDNNRLSPDIDGQYVYIEFKSQSSHIKTVHRSPFSNDEKNLINLLESIVKD